MSEEEKGDSVFDFEMMTHFTNRKDTLGKLQLHCPDCDSAQVQLLVYHSEPAQWRCRICKCKFDYEPPKES